MNFCKRILGAICFYAGIDRLFYWLNRKAKRVVTYHNVLPDDLFWAAEGSPVALPESEFRRQVREMTRYLKADADFAASGTLTITFDDGYLNQYEVAPRALEAEGIRQAVIFVSDDALSAKGVLSALWADRELHGPGTTFDRPDFFHTAIGREYERLRLTGMTVDQIEDLRRRGWKIGYHTKSHRKLADMDMSEKRQELAPPEWLKDKILSYPFGRAWEVDPESVAITESYGYECAFSNQCEDDGRVCRHFLPRMVIMDDKYWLHFELSGAKYFFKYRKLLPKVIA